MAALSDLSVLSDNLKDILYTGIPWRYYDPFTSSVTKNTLNLINPGHCSSLAKIPNIGQLIPPMIK